MNQRPLKLFTEWTSDRDFAARVDNLSGRGSGPRSNGDYYLKWGDTVQDDAEASIDVLTGGAGEDWFWFNLHEDRTTDLKDEVFAGDLDFIL